MRLQHFTSEVLAWSKNYPSCLGCRAVSAGDRPFARVFRSDASDRLGLGLKVFLPLPLSRSICLSVSRLETDLNSDTRPTFSELLRDNPLEAWSTAARDADIQAALLSADPYAMRAAVILRLFTTPWSSSEDEADLIRAMDRNAPQRERDDAHDRYLSRTAISEPRGLHTIVTLIDQIAQTRPDIAFLALYEIHAEFATRPSRIPPVLSTESALHQRLMQRLEQDPTDYRNGRFPRHLAPFLTLEEAACATRDPVLCALTVRTLTQRTFSDNFDVLDRDAPVRAIAAHHMTLDPEGLIRTLTSCSFNAEDLVELPAPHCHENPIPLFFEPLVAPLVQRALRRIDRSRLPDVAALICNTVQQSLKHDFAERIGRNSVRLLVSTLRRVRREVPEYHEGMRAFVSSLKPPSPHRPPPRRLPPALRRALLER